MTHTWMIETTAKILEAKGDVRIARALRQPAVNDDKRDAEIAEYIRGTIDCLYSSQSARFEQKSLAASALESLTGAESVIRQLAGEELMAHRLRKVAENALLVIRDLDLPEKVRTAYERNLIRSLENAGYSP